MVLAPSYYAIIPADVRYDGRLSASEKLMYGEITALSSREGFCWASNDYFADLYGVVPTTASAWVKHLAELGYIILKIDNADKRMRRRIWIASSTAMEKPEAFTMGKSEATASGKPEGNNTSPNTTSLNKKAEGYREVVDDYFALHQERTGSKPMWAPAEGQLLKRLLTAFPAEEIRRRLAAYYHSEHWFTKGGAYSFRQFSSHFDELAGQGPAPAKDGFITDDHLRERNSRALEEFLQGAKEGQA